MGKTKKSEKGAVMLVEAALVFPIVFAVVFLMIYLGNAFFLRAKVDNIVTHYAIAGAAQCADPYLSLDKFPTTSKGIDIMPYRYIITNFPESIETEILGDVTKAVKGTGLMKNMEPIATCDVDYNTSIFYPTFSVEVGLEVRFPMNFLGDIPFIKFNSYDEMPVTDTGEFIRDVDMAVDFVESNKTIQTAMTAVKEFFGALKGSED